MWMILAACGTAAFPWWGGCRSWRSWGFFSGASLTIFVQDREKHAHSSHSWAKLIKCSCPEPAGVRGTWPSAPGGEGDVVWQSSGFVPARAGACSARGGGETANLVQLPQRGLGSAQIWLVPEPLSSHCQVPVMWFVWCWFSGWLGSSSRPYRKSGCLIK